jgi:hypothetical protein
MRALLQEIRAVLVEEEIKGLALELQNRMQDLLGNPLSVAKGKELAKWLEGNFFFQGSKTPKGGKELKKLLSFLHQRLNVGMGQVLDLEKFRPSIEVDWKNVSDHLGDIVKLFTAEGGKSVPKEIKVGANTYRNLVGFSESKAKEYIEALEQVFASLKGWRKKALAGGITVALAGPKDFHGTAGGKYKVDEDVLYVRATPNVLKRTLGTYGAFDYIIVHELGHRYWYKRKPQVDFDRSEWWTSKYSRKEGESFAELFALTNFGIAGYGDQKVYDRFEEYMTTGKSGDTEPVELPAHLRKLFDKPKWQGHKD